MRIGILGGTFNPPHLGHLVCAQEARWQLGLERVLLIPAARSPFKDEGAGDPGVEHRLAMCRAAAAGDSGLEVSAVEAERPGPSYTVDTLQILHSLAPDSELFLIVGGDVAAGLPGWREPEQVLTLATLAVAERSGTASSSVQTALAGLRGGERAVSFAMPTIEISSTGVRERVGSGRPIGYLVPDGVRDYIEEHRLYGHGGIPQC